MQSSSNSDNSDDSHNHPPGDDPEDADAAPVIRCNDEEPEVEEDEHGALAMALMAEVDEIDNNSSSIYYHKDNAL